MNDMSAVIVPKSDQWNADDLISGPRTIHIVGVKITPGTEQPVSILIDGDSKVFRPCKSMSRVLVAVWGPDAKAYVGRSLTLYRDPKVKWGGMEVGGIRISHMSDLEGPKTMALTETRASRKPFTVKPLVGGQSAAASITLDEARDAIEAATTLDDLRTTWSRKVMAPHREMLQPVLDARKAALETASEPGQGRADEQHGDQFDGTDVRRTKADELIGQAEAVTKLTDLDALSMNSAGDIDALPDELQDEVKQALKDARVRLGSR